LNRKIVALLAGSQVVIFLALAALVQPVRESIADPVSNVFVTNGNNDPIPVNERARTRLIQFVDTPYVVDFGRGVHIATLVSPKESAIPIAGFRQVCMMVSPQDVSTSTAGTYDVLMGKLKGTESLAEFVGEGLQLGEINCFAVLGPEMEVRLSGQGGTTDKLLIWVYLSS